jgi:tetratricopeptide (TPR) repeat protein
MNDRTLSSESQHLERLERHRRLPPALRQGVWITCIIAVSAGCATPIKHYYSDKNLNQINVGADRPHILAMFEGMEIRSKQRDPAGNLLEVGEVILINSASERKPYWFLFKNGRLAQWGPREDPATPLTKVAPPDQVRGENAKAEPLYRRALSRLEQIWDRFQILPDGLRALPILRQVLGSEQPAATGSLTPTPMDKGPATHLTKVAPPDQVRGENANAEPLDRRAPTSREQALGSEEPTAAQSLTGLAFFFQTQGHYTRAESLFEWALAIRQKTLGPDHPDVATSLENYAALLRKANRATEAPQLEARAKAIRARQAKENPAK